ncbi:hypothetical protein ACTXT7_000049 [Hymenolepis weldensis]
MDPVLTDAISGDDKCMNFVKLNWKNTIADLSTADCLAQQGINTIDLSTHRIHALAHVCISLYAHAGTDSRVPQCFEMSGW